jgi:hypothetical protein
MSIDIGDTALSMVFIWESLHGRASVTKTSSTTNLKSHQVRVFQSLASEWPVFGISPDPSLHTTVFNDTANGTSLLANMARCIGSCSRISGVRTSERSESCVFCGCPIDRDGTVQIGRRLNNALIGCMLSQTCMTVF